MENKRILFIRNGYNSKTSGGDVHCNLLMNKLAEMNNVEIFLPYREKIINYNDTIERIYHAGLPFEYMFYSNNFLLMLVYLYRIFVSIFFLRKNNSDLVIAYSHLFHDIIPLFFIRNKRIKIATFIFHVIQEQNRTGLYGKFTFFLEKISFFILKKREILVITDSGFVSDQLVRKYGFNRKYIKTSTNGLDLEFINQINGYDDKNSDLVFCGRLHKRKGVYDLIDIVEGVKKDFPNVTCRLIGDGTERENLKKTIEERHLSRNFEFTGLVSEEEKIKFLKSGGIFVFPSYEEGWGIAIGEALACGLSVIVYDLIDIRNIWRNSVSWIRLGDISAFVTEIERFILNKELMREKRIFGIDFVKNMTWKEVLESEIGMLDSINK